MIAIQYDGYNSAFYDKFIGGGYIGTITTEAPRIAMRHGWKIVEVFEL